MLVGADLRQARLRAGLNAVQVSERTKIQLHKIEALEKGSYENLPGGIYLDGLVRAYAREVGLDAERLIERAREERAAAVGWTTTPSDLEAFRAEHVPSGDPPPVAEPDLDPGELRIHLSPEATSDYRQRTRSITFEHTRAAPPAGSRSAPDEAFERYATRRLRHTSRRSHGKALAVVSLLALFGWGAYLYQAAAPRDQSPTADTASPLPTDSPGEPTSAAPTETRGETPPIDIRLPAEDRASTAGDERRESAVSPGIAERQAVSQPESSASYGTASATPPRQVDVSGSWRLATKVESSSLARYSGLQIGYQLELKQSGNRVTGAGRKVAENDKELGGRAQTRITLQGSLEGNQLTLAFTERGARRPTRGKFSLILDESGGMKGQFSSSAAKSAGSVEARRTAP
jgi:cytoskeletal protein RodZ